MSHYPKEVTEQVILNLYRAGKTEQAYDAIFDSPELSAEMEAEDLTCAQMLDRITKRKSGE